MGIPSTQNASSTSQCKQGYIKRDRNNELILRKVTVKPTTFVQSVVATTIFLLIAAPCVIACPSGCSCDATTATCSHQEYTATPIGFTSQIDTLYLYNNNITRIRAETLRPLQNLKLLDLSGNRISDFVLWDGIFSNMNKLENLMLQENRITKVSKKMFKGLTKLVRIYLQHNRISMIDPGAFDNLPALVELKLSHNKLGSFPVLSRTPNLLLLDLSSNRLGTIRDMAFSTVNLEYLKLHNNRLTELRTSIFDDTSRLTKLDISNNRLTAVPQVIKSFTSLVSLNMSLNKVGSISKDTFTEMRRLKMLDIHGMGLTDFPRGIIPERVILNLLDITENDWSCQCGMHWLPEYMQIFRDSLVEPDSIKCSTSSKHPGRQVKELKIDEFSCTQAELEEETATTTLVSATPTSQLATTTKHRWFPNPCVVFECWNGGTCYVEGRTPKCRCTRYWDGERCQISLRTPTSTVKSQTSLSTTTQKITKITKEKPRLLINRDSITDRSVEIILPITERELDVTILEMETHQKLTSQKIRPQVHPFTIDGLDSGKNYNICIHLQDSSRRNSDTLCGIVHTDVSKDVDRTTTKIRIVPSHDIKAGEKTKNKGIVDISQPGYEDQYSSNDDPADTSQNSDFKAIFPAVGAAVGAVVILSVLIVLFVCYRHRKIGKLKGHSNSDYVPGSPTEPSLNDLEMTTVVHHHHHNHYNANQNAKKGGKKQNNQKLTNNNSAKSVTSQKTSSLSRNSVSSSINSGTTHSRFTDTPQQYHQQQHTAPLTPNHPPYDTVQLPRANGRSDFMYRQPSNNSVVPMPNMHCIPVNRHYEPEIVDDTQPMLTEMGQYAPYAHSERQVYHDIYPPNHRSEYTPQNGPISPYARSAFQPIQGPRQNTVRTPTSDSGPIMTHVNTAQVMPTSSCLNRNLIGNNMLRYPEGVPVV